MDQDEVHLTFVTWLQTATTEAVSVRYLTVYNVIHNCCRHLCPFRLKWTHYVFLYFSVIYILLQWWLFQIGRPVDVNVIPVSQKVRLQTSHFISPI